MAETYNDVKGTINEKLYQQALETFLSSNASDLSAEKKQSILANPDEYVIFSETEDGLEATLKLQN